MSLEDDLNEVLDKISMVNGKNPYNLRSIGAISDAVREYESLMEEAKEIRKAIAKKKAMRESRDCKMDEDKAVEPVAEKTEEMEEVPQKRGPGRPRKNK
jgi:hypothetical protein